MLTIAPKEKKKIFCIFKEKENIPWLLSFALIGLLLCQYSFLETINLSNSATATVLQSLNVIMMALIVSASTGKRITLLQSLSIFFAILGTYLIATKGSFSQIMISTSTLIWGILSAVGVVTYTLLSRNLIKKLDETNRIICLRYMEFRLFLYKIYDASIYRADYSLFRSLARLIRVSNSFIIFSSSLNLFLDVIKSGCLRGYSS